MSYSPLMATPSSSAASESPAAITVLSSTPLERANDRLLLWLVGLSVPLTIGLTVSAFAHTETSTTRVQLITAGVVKAILVEAGKTVPVGTVLAVIEPSPK